MDPRLMEAQDFGEPELAVAAGLREAQDDLEIVATLDDGHTIPCSSCHCGK